MKRIQFRRKHHYLFYRITGHLYTNIKSSLITAITIFFFFCCNKLSNILHALICRDFCFLLWWQNYIVLFKGEYSPIRGIPVFL